MSRGLTLAAELENVDNLSASMYSVHLHSSTMASSSLDAPSGVTRPIVFFDINIGDTPAGRIKMGEWGFLQTDPT